MGSLRRRYVRIQLISAVHIIERFRVSWSEYIVTSRQVTLQRPELVFWIHSIVLTTDDQPCTQLDTKHVPNSTLNDRLSSTFRLPVGVDIAYGFDIMMTSSRVLRLPIRYCQILENEKFLLVLVDQENVYIYLDRFPAMDTAVRGRPTKLLKRERLGREFLFAFDETKRVLVVCASVMVLVLYLA
jgi:hypothetical protein